MQLTKTTVKKIFASFPGYTFVASERFWWSAEHKAIHYSPITSVEDLWTLLHELGHAELGHHTYGLDIELLAQEVAAWEHARTVLGPRFLLAVSDEHTQDHLDTYRHWLHERSRCPNCEQNGLQTTQNTYNCLNCRCSWRVNDARDCALRRVRLRKVAVIKQLG